MLFDLFRAKGVKDCSSCDLEAAASRSNSSTTATRLSADNHTGLPDRLDSSLFQRRRTSTSFTSSSLDTASWARLVQQRPSPAAELLHEAGSGKLLSSSGSTSRGDSGGGAEGHDCIPGAVDGRGPECKPGLKVRRLSLRIPESGDAMAIVRNLDARGTAKEAPPQQAQSPGWPQQQQPKQYIHAGTVLPPKPPAAAQPPAVPLPGTPCGFQLPNQPLATWGRPIINLNGSSNPQARPAVGRSISMLTPQRNPSPQPQQPEGPQLVRFDTLKLMQQIGEGGFGKVYYGHLNKRPVAIKLANMRGPDMSQLVSEFQREVSTMCSIPPQENILKLVAACTEAPNLALVTEYCSRGSLYSLLHSPTTPDMPRQQMLSVWLGVARGMAHLHSCHPPVLHRDLKSANLLLDDMGTVKICDFGLSRIYADMHAQALTGGLGTYQWMAPEVLAHQRYSAKADVYSFAIVCWECLTRKLPYAGMTPMQAALAVVNHGLRPELPKGLEPQIASLIKSCWAPVPEQRPSFDEIVATLQVMVSASPSSAASSMGGAAAPASPVPTAYTAAAGSAAGAMSAGSAGSGGSTASALASGSGVVGLAGAVPAGTPQQQMPKRMSAPSIVNLI